MDLSSLISVRVVARGLTKGNDISYIDVLVLNAGIIAAPYDGTADVFEMQFAISRLGLFAFVNMVIPRVLEAVSLRVVVVSSNAHRMSATRRGDSNYHVPQLIPRMT